MTHAEALKAARALIEHGWCKFWLHEPGTDNYCARGAVQHITYATTPYPQSFTAQVIGYLDRAVIDDIYLGGLHAIEAYNDHQDTTKENVLAVFDRAIDAAEKEETYE